MVILFCLSSFTKLPYMLAHLSNLSRKGKRSMEILGPDHLLVKWINLVKFPDFKTMAEYFYCCINIAYNAYYFYYEQMIKTLV